MKKLTNRISYDEIGKKFYCHTSRGVRTFIAELHRSVYECFECKDCDDKLKCRGPKIIRDMLKRTLVTQTFYCPFAKMEHKNEHEETEIWYCPFSKTINNVATCAAENYDEATDMLGCPTCGIGQFCNGPIEDTARIFDEKTPI